MKSLFYTIASVIFAYAPIVTNFCLSARAEPIPLGPPSNPGVYDDRFPPGDQPYDFPAPADSQPLTPNSTAPGRTRPPEDFGAFSPPQETSRYNANTPASSPYQSNGATAPSQAPADPLTQPETFPAATDLYSAPLADRPRALDLPPATISPDYQPQSPYTGPPPSTTRQQGLTPAGTLPFEEQESRTTSPSGLEGIQRAHDSGVPINSREEIHRLANSCHKSIQETWKRRPSNMPMQDTRAFHIAIGEAQERCRKLIQLQKELIKIDVEIQQFQTQLKTAEAILDHGSSANGTFQNRNF